MTGKNIPKNSSVIWAAIAVGAVIIGYLLGISTVSRTLSDGDNYMMLIYSEVSYEDINNWSQSVTDIEVTGSGIFPHSGSEMTGDSPRAFILFSAPSREIAEAKAQTFSGFNGKSRLKVIKKED